MKVEKSLPASRTNLLNATVVPVQVINANPAFVSEGFHLVHIAECNNNKTLAEKKKLVKAKIAELGTLVEVTSIYSKCKYGRNDYIENIIPYAFCGRQSISLEAGPLDFSSVVPVVSRFRLVSTWNSLPWS